MSSNSKWLSKLCSSKWVDQLDQEDREAWPEARKRLANSPDLWALALWLERRRVLHHRPLDQTLPNYQALLLARDGELRFMEELSHFFDTDKKLTL